MPPLPQPPDDGSTVDPSNATDETLSIDRDQTTRPGDASALQSWGHLQIRQRIGAGGFGEVFRAWDSTLDREVALKLLHPAVAAHTNLRSEGRLLAKLRHPNVVTVYGLAEHDGRIGMWGELIHGKTLSELLKQQGRFGAAEAASIGKEICRALAAAHASGLLHRDVKAQNVMREDGGRIVLMDFGLGVERNLPGAQGATMTSGTPVYMAPELLRGEPASVQSDIYALGVLLFHLVTGSFPVQRGTVAELREAHESGRRVLLPDVRPDVPESYAQTVRRALAPNPAERFQSVGELLEALSEQSQEDDSRATAAARRRWRQWMTLSPVAVVALAAVIYFAQPQRWFGGAEASIAVLPFSNLSAQAEDEYLVEGISEELINALAKSDNLRVIARASTLSFTGADRNLAEIAGRLRVDSLLTGRVRRIGDRIRISVELVRASDGTQLWSQTYEHDPKGMFATQQQISRSVADVLNVNLTRTTAADVNSDAYAAFLQGDFFLRKGNPANTARAIEYFNVALQHDPNYARAYAGLARAYVGIAITNVPSPDLIAKARDAANRALQLDSRLSEAHASLGYLKVNYDWDWQGAESEFRRAIEASPKNADARFFYAGLLMNLERTGESAAQLRLAEELDPLSPTLPWFRAILLFVERRYAEGEREILKMLASSPENPNSHTSHGIIAFALGKNEEAVASFRRAFEVAKTPIVKARLGWALGHAGHTDEARRLLRELEDAASRDEAAPAQVAIVAGGLGELDTAFRWLDEAVRLHDPALVQARIAPMFSELRADPRFERVLERVGLKTTR